MGHSLIGGFRGFCASSNPPFIKTMAIINIYDFCLSPQRTLQIVTTRLVMLTNEVPTAQPREFTQPFQVHSITMRLQRRAVEAGCLMPHYPKSESEMGNQCVHTVPGAPGEGIWFCGRLFVLFLFDDLWR